MTRRTGIRGKNSEEIQRQNRLLVLSLIREKKVTSRVMLAEETGLKQATITNIVNELIELDYVVETGLIEGNNGRRVKGIMLNEDKIRILCARINSDYYAVGIYDLDGNCIKVEKTFWNSCSSFEERLNILKLELLLLRDREGAGRKIIGCGIVLESNINNVAGNARSDGKLELYIQNYLENALNMYVYVDSMSNMGAYFAWNDLQRKKENIETLVFLEIGYSVDCAVICNGNILYGRNHKAGHYGHVSIDMNGPLCECGNRGCIKNYISVGAMKKKVGILRERFPESELSEDSNVRDLIWAYYDKEELMTDFYDNYYIEKLAVIVVNLINQFNPEEIIFGDEVPTSDSFVEKVRAQVQMRMPQHRYERVKINAMQELRKTEYDVGMRGMCQYVAKEQLRNMDLN